MSGSPAPAPAPPPRDPAAATNAGPDDPGERHAFASLPLVRRRGTTSGGESATFDKRVFEAKIREIVDEPDPVIRDGLIDLLVGSIGSLVVV